MKNVIYLSCFVFFAIMLFPSCGGSSSGKEISDESTSNVNTIESPIVGKWEIVKAEGTAASVNKGMVYTFKDNGNSDINGTMYKFSINNDTLFMDYDGEGSIILKWIYNINGNNMTLQNATDADQKFWMERK